MVFISCDPGYNVLIMNKTENNLIIITQPAIEKRIAIKQGPSYDSFISYKKNDLKDLNLGIYELEPDDKIFLFGTIGHYPNEYLPFESVKIVKDGDTLIVDNQNLTNLTKREEKNLYYIEIK